MAHLPHATNSSKAIAKFVFPSLLGVVLFLVPVEFQGTSSLIVGIFVTLLQQGLGEALPAIMTVLLCVPTLIALIHRLHPIKFIQQHPALQPIFTTTPFWLVVRVIGAVLAPLILFQVGPEAIYSAKTGGNVLFKLLPTCGTWFLASGLLLPLLTDYGAMDFVGALFRKIARPIFRLPGRALMDCFASWVGSGVCGTMLTLNQYDMGYYTAREAAIIITNFSVVGIGFTSAIAQYLDISSVFFPLYATIAVAGVLCAIVTPRIWPLSRINDSYNLEKGKQITEQNPQHISSLSWGFQVAVKKASTAPNLSALLSNGLLVTATIIAGTCPVLIAFGTTALIVAEYTPFFTIISYPFIPLLRLLQVPFAAETAPTMIIGFADQFLPVITGAAIPSLFTRFVIGAVTVLQIIYMTEIGALILTSKIPLSFGKLFVIFLERTLICLPVVVLLANLFAI